MTCFEKKPKNKTPHLYDYNNASGIDTTCRAATFWLPCLVHSCKYHGVWLRMKDWTGAHDVC